LISGTDISVVVGVLRHGKLRYIPPSTTIIRH